MRFAQPLAGWLSTLAVCGVLTGCRTLEPDVPVGEYTPTLLPLDDGQEVFAEVLASYAQGILYDLEHAYDAALTNYLHAVALDPLNEELNVRIAMGLLQQKRTDEAIELIEALAEREPDSESAQAWLALVYGASKKPDQAIAAYRRLIDIAPGKPSSYIELAGFYLRLGRKDQTIETLRLGIEQAEEKLEIYRSLAKLYIKDATKTASAEEAHLARKQAILLLQKAIELAEDDVSLRLQLGDLQIREGNPGRAVRQFRAIEKLYPDDLGIKRRLAMNFLALGDNAQAIETLEALATADPTNGQLYYYLGELYREEGDLERATLNFTLAAAASTDNPAPHIRLASIQIDEAPEKAIATLQNALEQIPDHPRLTELLGHAYLSHQQYDLALEWLGKAVFRSGDAPKGRLQYQMAKASFLAGNPDDDTLSYISRAVDEDARYLQPFVSDLLEHSGEDLGPAVKLLQRLADNTRDEPAVYLYLGMIKSYAERYEEAVLDFSRAEELAGENRSNTQIIDDDFYFSYGAAHERLGNLEQAEDLFNKALELNARHPNAHNYLAYMWSERGERLEEALEHIRIALDIEPDSGAFLDTLGWIYYQQGKYADALREIQRALEMTPGDPTVTEHLGDTFIKLGRTEEAIAQWTESFLLDPDSASVATKLSERGIDLAPLRKRAEMRAGQQKAPAPPASEAIDDDIVFGDDETQLDESVQDPDPETIEQQMQELGVPIAPTNRPPPVIQMAPEGKESTPPGE